MYSKCAMIREMDGICLVSKDAELHKETCKQSLLWMKYITKNLLGFAIADYIYWMIFKSLSADKD